MNCCITSGKSTEHQNKCFETKVIVCPTKERMPLALFSLIGKSFVDAIQTRKQTSFTIALSGGSIPALLSGLPAFFADSNIEPQWSKWHVILADERIVPLSHKDSNLNSINSAFLNAVSIPKDQIFGIDESMLSSDPNLIAEEYENRALQPILRDRKSWNNTHGEIMMIDCALLGFGPDGHTCSLFPGHHLVEKKQRHEISMVAGISSSPKPPSNRITLTIPVLNEMTSDIIFIGAGDSKAEVLKDIFSKIQSVSKDGEDKRILKATFNDTQVLPCGMIQPERGNLVWLIDEKASGLLDVSDSKL